MTPLYGHDAAVAAFRAGIDCGPAPPCLAARRAEGDRQGAVRRQGGAARARRGAGAGRRARPRRSRRPSGRAADRRRQPSRSDAARAAGARTARRRARPHRSTSTRSAACSACSRPPPRCRPGARWSIDSIDDLERGGANALLKNLEEPPPSTVFLLVSHAPERLLPTIRSRCRLLRFSPLDDDAMTSALARRACPTPTTSEIAALAKVGEGRAGPRHRLARASTSTRSTGRWTRWSARAIRPMPAARALAQSLALKSAQPRYEAFLARAPSRIAAEARSAARPGAGRGARGSGSAPRPRRQRPAPLARPAEHGVRAGRHARRAGAGERA